MLIEVWDYLTTKAPSWTRRHGYLHYSIAMAKRARRCRPYWGEHLGHCHQKFANFFAQYPQARSCAILGSGLLLETPLHLVPSSMEKIFLVDAVHTKEVCAYVRNLAPGLQSKIEWIQADLLQPLPLKVDLVISGNLLSQLPLLPINKLPERERVELRLQIQKQHLQDIKKMSQAALLFTDYNMQFVNKAGDLLQEEHTVDADALNLKWSTQWIWNLAPAPEVDPNYSIQLQEGCVILI